jgi:hypothetical protein
MSTAADGSVASEIGLPADTVLTLSPNSFKQEINIALARIPHNPQTPRKKIHDFPITTAVKSVVGDGSSALMPLVQNSQTNSHHA